MTIHGKIATFPKIQNSMPTTTINILGKQKVLHNAFNDVGILNQDNYCIHFRLLNPFKYS